MAQVKVFHDKARNTLVVLSGNPEDEHEVEETREMLLIKDKDRKVIGFEKLNFISPASASAGIAFETLII